MRHTRKTIFLSPLHLKLDTFKNEKALAPDFHFEVKILPIFPKLV